MTLQFRQVSKQFIVNQQPINVLDSIDLTLHKNELVAIIGASGCGKSTLLRLASGLEQAEQGSILLDGKPLTGILPQISLVFQEARLFPWLTVAQNIALGMEHRGLGTADKAEQIVGYLSMVGLSGFAEAFPHQLSGGMAQRVAIARGLASQPDILLLDEPFGALDALKRQQLQDALVNIRQQTQLSILLVTHDVEEALYLADRVVVMSPHPGRIRTTIPVDLPWPRQRTDSVLQRQRQVLYDLL